MERNDTTFLIALALLALALICFFGAYQDYAGLQKERELNGMEIRIGVHQSADFTSSTQFGWFTLLTGEIGFGIVLLGCGIKNLSDYRNGK